MAACILLLISCSNYTSKNNKSALLAGIYKLLYIEVLDSSGNYHEEDWAKGGESYILYDGKDHMMVQIIPKAMNVFSG